MEHLRRNSHWFPQQFFIAKFYYTLKVFIVAYHKRMLTIQIPWTQVDTG